MSPPERVLTDILLIPLENFTLNDWGINKYKQHYSCSEIKVYFNADRLSMGVFIELKGQFALYGSRWYFGEPIETLKGTTRTLDEVDGETELEDGIISKSGYAVLDDSNGFISDEKEGFIKKKAKWTYTSSLMDMIIEEPSETSIA